MPTDMALGYRSGVSTKIRMVGLRKKPAMKNIRFIASLMRIGDSRAPNHMVTICGTPSKIRIRDKTLAIGRMIKIAPTVFAVFLKVL